jgi:sugar phosphate permease
MLLASGVVELAFALPYSLPLWVAGALLLGLTSQAVKISVDTLIQHHVVDAFRGRVFALYDMLFNLALVVAAVTTAVALPEDGHSPTTVVVLAAGWAGIAGAYVSRSLRTTPSAR